MSRFVSAGSTEETSERDEAWAKAQERIDATKQQKDKPRVGEQEGGKSLYEHLQSNKAAKQEAFEEATRLRNQFQTLDEDEVAFLDSVLESTREKEAEVRKETRDQLDAFRRQQEEAEKAAKQSEGSPEAPVEDAPTWSVGPRKRKKGREKDGIGGVKLRKSSIGERKADEGKMDEKVDSKAETSKADASGDPASVTTTTAGGEVEPMKAKSTASAKASRPAPSTGLGLGAYSSDEDD